MRHTLTLDFLADRVVEFLAELVGDLAGDDIIIRVTELQFRLLYVCPRSHTTCQSLIVDGFWIDTPE